jgi:L-serine kinase (ADP)|tara:strand:- start:41 stop:430 length:390 start_codon:yes stop_codon:yes gene_type:complete
MRELKLLSLDRIQETEEHDFIRANQLADAIRELGFWTVPIAIEHSMLAIMDGHHRFNAAKLLNLARVPCVLMDYEKSGVTLQSWRSDWDVDVADFFLMLKEGKQFPMKTTRHLFNPSIKEIMIPLDLLF